MFLLHAALWPALKYLPYHDRGTQYGCHYKQPGGHQPGTGVPREQQPQPQLRAWGNNPSKHLQQEEGNGENKWHLDCKTMPLHFPWVTGRLTDTGAAEQKHAVLAAVWDHTWANKPRDQSWLSALWGWKPDADKWRLALERASMGLGFISSGFAPYERI